MKIEDKIDLNLKQVTESIEKIVSSKHIGYIDAIVTYCDQNGIEIETIASLIKKNAVMKSKIQLEGEDINMLPRKARLPDFC